MRVAVLFRKEDPLSLLRYRDSVMEELYSMGISMTLFGDGDNIPAQCDLVWEPGISGLRTVSQNLQACRKPLVATVHGAAAFAVKWHEYFSDPFEAARARRAKLAALHEWTFAGNKIDAVIAVSRFGAKEIANVYGLDLKKISPIYHGVNSAVFYPTKMRRETESYFFHVSAFQPVKNLKRLIKAYEQLPANTRPRLIVVSPGFGTAPHIAGLTVIDRPLTSPELAKLYNGALGFIFPSLRETFGLPIIEAMACGCPVITSFDTACAEVAGDAALLVDPRSTDDITHAMSRLLNEPDLRSQLIQKGLARAAQFTWAESARLHTEVFRSVLE